MGGEKRREGRGRPEASPGRGSEQPEARGLLNESGAGGLHQGGCGLPCIDQRIDQQSPRGGGGERLRERGSQPIKGRGQGSKEGSHVASLLPEARGESMTESQREEKSRESTRADRLPWERGESLGGVRQRREGRGAQRRGEHVEKSDGAEARGLGLDRERREQRRGGQGRPARLSHSETMRHGA